MANCRSRPPSLRSPGAVRSGPLGRHNRLPQYVAELVAFVQHLAHSLAGQQFTLDIHSQPHPRLPQFLQRDAQLVIENPLCFLRRRPLRNSQRVMCRNVPTARRCAARGPSKGARPRPSPLELRTPPTCRTVLPATSFAPASLPMQRTFLFVAASRSKPLPLPISNSQFSMAHFQFRRVRFGRAVGEAGGSARR